jgi:hypothetical protein
MKYFFIHITLEEKGGCASGYDLADARAIGFAVLPSFLEINVN